MKEKIAAKKKHEELKKQKEGRLALDAGAAAERLRIHRAMGGSTDGPLK